MTTEARVNQIETQLQQLGSNLITLSSANISNATHIAALIDATGANTRAIAEMRDAVDGLRQATLDLTKAVATLNERVGVLEDKIDAIDQKLEDRTNDVLAAIDQGFDRAIARVTEPIQAQITGLQTEMQRVLEILTQLQQGN